jgi:hypothetical protein
MAAEKHRGREVRNIVHNTPPPANFLCNRNKCNCANHNHLVVPATTVAAVMNPTAPVSSMRKRVMKGAGNIFFQWSAIACKVHSHFSREDVAYTLRYGASMGGSKTCKRNILQVC